MENGNGGVCVDFVGTIRGGEEEREVVEKGTIRQSGWKEENWRDGGQSGREKGRWRTIRGRGEMEDKCGKTAARSHADAPWEPEHCNSSLTETSALCSGLCAVSGANAVKSSQLRVQCNALCTVKHCMYRSLIRVERERES